MEASAHALKLHKLHGIKFSVGALTNISRDHLDYFDSMDEYANVKFSLANSCEKFVTNVDDKLCKTVGSDITFGIDSYASVSATNLSITPTGSVFTVTDGENRYRAFCPLVGRFNVYNSLCAISMSKLLGVEVQKSLDGLSKMSEVDGRVNVIHAKGGEVIIDFAHTPDGLKKILTCAHEICKNKLTVVFGCGGNRDKGKRYLMGEVSASVCDRVIVTLDNPRDEERPRDLRDPAGGGFRQHHPRRDPHRDRPRLHPR